MIRNYEPFLIGGCICIVITLFFIYLCKKLSINYKTFLLHSFFGLLLYILLGIINYNTININTNALGKNIPILWALCPLIIGFLIPQEIISFPILLLGLTKSYFDLGIRHYLFWLSTKPDVLAWGIRLTILDDAIFKTIFAFFIIMSTFLLWAIVHKKYKIIPIKK